MNRPPEILVNSGYVTDENGVLTEMVIPSNVQTLSPPTTLTVLSENIVWLPSDYITSRNTLLTFNAPNAKSIDVVGTYNSANNGFKLFPSLVTLNLPKLESISVSGGGGNVSGACAFAFNTKLTSANFNALKTVTIGQSGYGTGNGFLPYCSSLTSLIFPELVSTSESYQNTAAAANSNNGLFANCTSLESISCPKLVTIDFTASNHGRLGTFYNCSALSNVNLPELQTVTGRMDSYTNTNKNTYAGIFNYCLSLTTLTLHKLKSVSDRINLCRDCNNLVEVTLGSVGNPVTNLPAYTFVGCDNLATITVYTEGGASLANEPWGATNANLIDYKQA